MATKTKDTEAAQAPKAGETEVTTDSGSESGWSPKTKGKVRLAHRIVTGKGDDRLELTPGREYPVGTDRGEVDPAWLASEPHLDADHPDCVRAAQENEAFRQRLEAEAAAEKGKVAGYVPGQRRKVGIA